MKKKMNDRLKTVRAFTILLFIVTVAIWIALVFVKLFFFKLEPGELLDEIMSNILGILPPILIFNFVYEYFTQKFIADEISEKVADTIMGHSDVLAGFKDEQKIEFIKSTINTMVSEDNAEMINAVIYPYITNNYNIRTYYKYSITLREYKESELFSDEKYIKVYEDLKFSKKYLNDNNLPQSFHVAFITANHELDSALRNQTYIFQENLSVGKEELQWMLSLEKSEQKRFIINDMQLSLYVDNRLAEIADVSFSEAGIDIEFKSYHNNREERENGKYYQKTEHMVEISFTMPQLKGHSEFLVSINEPTYAPLIQLSYPEDIMQVRAYSFLNDGDDSSVERATHNVGTYEFCVQNKWIYPVGGVVFAIDCEDN